MKSNMDSIAVDVRQLYLKLLLTEPDAGGFDFWVDKISSGEHTLDDLKNILLESPDYKIIQSLIPIYRELLGRYPDTGGIEYYKGQINKGWTYDDIRRDIMQSDERKKYEYTNIPDISRENVDRAIFESKIVYQTYKMPTWVWIAVAGLSIVAILFIWLIVKKLKSK